MITFRSKSAPGKSLKMFYVVNLQTYNFNIQIIGCNIYCLRFCLFRCLSFKAFWFWVFYYQFVCFFRKGKFCYSLSHSSLFPFFLYSTFPYIDHFFLNFSLSLSLCTSTCVCLTVCLSLSLCLCLPLYIYLCLFDCLRLSVSLCLCLSLYIYLCCLTVCLSLPLCLSLSLSVSLCKSTCVCLTACLCLSVCLSVC